MTAVDLLAADLRAMPDEQLVAVALRDDLTGLWRRCALPLLDRRRPPTGQVVVFIDLDRFKTVNDTLGHGAGDALLALVGAALNGMRNARAVRWGGDEFLVLFDAADPARDAAVLCGRVRDVLTLVGVRASVGAAPVGPDGLHQAIDAADRAMCRDKATRR